MKATYISMIIAVVLMGGAFVFIRNNAPEGPKLTPVNNVSVVNGKQIIEIYAKGGYQPRRSVAKAGIPTVIRFKTSGTFDCSSSVRIPSMNITRNLPQNGSLDIDLGTQQVSTLKGSCGMGMYPFEIEFAS